MKLTDKDLALLQPMDKSYKVYLGESLTLMVMKKTGTKVYRLKYRIDNKEQCLIVGRFPDLKIDEALDRVRKFKKELAKRRYRLNVNRAMDKGEAYGDI